MTLNFEEIKKIIPQRFPFIMIDSIIDLEPGKEATAIKNISGNDIFFLGHFPDKAIMPGAAIIEAMAAVSTSSSTSSTRIRRSRCIRPT